MGRRRTERIGMIRGQKSYARSIGPKMNMKRSFKPHPQFEERKRSAITLIKYVLTAKQPEVLPTHRQELLTILLWKLTLAPCRNKYATRYQSKGAMDGGSKLRHDHVYQRKKMIAALEKAGSDEVDNILKRAIACTVTVEEHDRLSKFKGYDGWDRYQKAGIEVIDTQILSWRRP